MGDDLTTPRFNGDYFHEKCEVKKGAGALGLRVGVAINVTNAEEIVRELRTVQDAKLRLEGGQADMFASSQEAA